VRIHATAFSILAALALASGGCADAPEGPPAEGDVMEGFQLIVGIDRASYPPGGDVRAVLRLVNRADAERVLSFPTSQRYDLVLLDDEEREVWRWSDEMAFAQVLGEERFGPGEEGPEWEVYLRAPETPGEYRLEARVPATGGRLEASVPLEVGGT
jgi:hypothetical protein